MLLEIPAVLDAAQLASVKQFLGQATFVDGGASAGVTARRVKTNLELDRTQPHRDQLVGAVLAALQSNPIFRHACLPARLATPIFSRYDRGMAYGDHVDEPLMGGIEPAAQYRADISMTLFISSPEEYRGGELVIATPHGETRAKLPAGHLLVYPSSYRHRVERVLEGSRLVMVGWLQSQVRDPERRRLLFDLWRGREQLLADAPDSDTARWIDTCYVNLVRMWANP